MAPDKEGGIGQLGTLLGSNAVTGNWGLIPKIGIYHDGVSQSSGQGTGMIRWGLVWLDADSLLQIMRIRVDSLTCLGRAATWLNPSLFSARLFRTTASWKNWVWCTRRKTRAWTDLLRSNSYLKK
jgi:hypothetical protein